MNPKKTAPDASIPQDPARDQAKLRIRIMGFLQQIVPDRATQQREYLAGERRFSELSSASREALLARFRLAGRYMGFEPRYVTQGKGRWHPTYLELQHPVLGKFPFHPAAAENRREA